MASSQGHVCVVVRGTCDSPGGAGAAQAGGPHGSSSPLGDNGTLPPQLRERLARRSPGLFPSGSFSEGSGAPFPSGRRFHWRRPGGCPHGRLRAGPVGAPLLPPPQHPGPLALRVQHTSVHEDQASCHRDSCVVGLRGSSLSRLRAAA
ncbi:hypothetical protein MRX96_010333 [Rhipicephalus microplus]